MSESAAERGICRLHQLSPSDTWKIIELSQKCETRGLVSKMVEQLVQLPFFCMSGVRESVQSPHRQAKDSELS